MPFATSGSAVTGQADQVLRALFRSGWLADDGQWERALGGQPGRASGARPVRRQSLDSGPRPGPGQQPAEAVAGIDVGGTKIHAAVFALAHGRLFDQIIQTDPRGGREVTGQITELVSQLSRRAGIAGPPRRIAVGCPGAPDPDTGTVEQAPNIAGWERLDVVADLQARLGTRPSLHNDANLAAWGEYLWRPVRGGDLAFVTVGTGIGLGLVLGERLHAGNRGLAGEIGDLPFGAEPFAPENMVRGPLEEVVGGAGLERAYHRASGRLLRVPEIFAAATAGDSPAASVLDDLGRWLAMALRSVRAIVDPQTYVLGGGIGSRAETLAATRRWLAATGGPGLEVTASTFGNRAAVAGALAAASVAPSG